MRADLDTSNASTWLETRRQVQSLADVVLCEAAAFFLYRGKLYRERSHGQYVSSFLGSTDGCEKVLRLIERLDAGGTVEAVVVDNEGLEPGGPGRPILALVVGHLSHLWPDGRREPV